MRPRPSSGQMSGLTGSTRSRLLPLVVALVVAASVPLMGAPGDHGVAAAAQLRLRHCGTIPVEDEFHPEVQALASWISCRKARRIIEAYLDGPRRGTGTGRS